MTNLASLIANSGLTNSADPLFTLAKSQAQILIQDRMGADGSAPASLLTVAPNGPAFAPVAQISTGHMMQTLSVPTNEINVAAGTSAATLQSMINGAPAGSILRLAEGHFAFDRTVTVARDDISVIGAGSNKTIIDVKSSLGAEAFRIGQGTMTGQYTLAADVAVGGKVLALTGPHSFVAGDYVYLSRASTEAFFDSIGDTQWRNTDVALRTSIAQVASVNGNVITLASGVHFDFVPGETTISEIAMGEKITIGGFTVSYGLSPADPSTFSNTMSAYDRNAVIEVKGTAGLSLFDITARDVPSIGVNVASSFGAKVDDLLMTGAHNKGDNGNGYGVQIRDVYNSTFTNLTDQDMRHSVVFASWTSAAGNLVHVLQTDRDINFHGGRDHDNVVMVDASIRDVASDIIGSIVFINTESTHYGSATDPTTNIIKFGQVVGSRQGDDVLGYDNGSWLSGMGGDDTLTGGTGNDLLTGGTEDDLLFGGAGVDIATFTGARSSFTISAAADGLHVTDKTGTHSMDIVNQVEWLLFDEGALRLSDMTFLATSAVNGVFTGPGTYQANAATVLTGTSGADMFAVTVAGTIVHGLAGSDTVQSTVDFVLLDDVERLTLIGTAAINGTGSNLSDRIDGNDAANLLTDGAGNDSLYGNGGNDIVLGGDGAPMS